MDEQKDLSVSNEDVLDNNDSSVNDEVPNIEENADTSNVSDDVNKAGNGYRGLASSNREAFSRGLSDNYNERIARNRANLNQSRANAANSKKEVETDNGVEEKDKTKLDNIKAKGDVLRNKGELAASKIDKARAGMYAVTNPKEAAKMAIKAKIRTWILASIVPITIGCLSLFVLFVGVLFILGLFEIDSQASGGSNLVYDASCNYEDTKVTVMDASNTKVLTTVSLEDYILGVVCPEIGACSGNVKNMAEHYLKAKFVATRTYVLSRGNYSSTTKSIIIRASTRDQQWCDLETGCVVTTDPELVPGYNSHYMNTYPGDYPEGEMIGIYSTKYFYTEEDLNLLHQYYEDTYGELYLSPEYKTAITNLDYRSATEYKSGTQLFWKEQAENGKLYPEILELTGTSGKPDAEDYVGKTIYKLGNYCAASIKNGNLVFLTDYPDYKSVESKQKINKPITTILSSEEINNLNSYIQTNVDQTGYGTGEAVVSAAQSLIYGLYQYGYYLPYWYGGGHSKGLSLGVDVNWGANGKNFDPSWVSSNYPNGNYYYSYDCSGFVSWSIKNACNSNYSGTSSSGFFNYGNGISLADAKPGDLMVISGSHVILIVKNTGDGVIAAESTSGYVKGGGGIIFTKYSSAGKYKVVDMQNWYASNCNNSR